MDLHLTKRHALVTGASVGLGAAIALQLASEGVRTVVHGLDLGSTEDVVARIKAAGGEAVGVAGDLSEDAAAADVAQRAQEAFGAIEILVNNAGRYFNQPWEQTAPNGWTELYNNNVTSMMRLNRILAAPMVARGWGRIINMASTNGLMPDVNMAAYASTKAAIHNMTVALSRDLGGKGVTVNSISPGLTFSDGVNKLLHAMVAEHGWPADAVALEKKAAESWAPNPVGRLGRPEEVASLVAFVGQPAS